MLLPHIPDVVVSSNSEKNSNPVLTENSICHHGLNYQNNYSSDGTEDSYHFLFVDTGGEQWNGE